jgi:hypothetical protein
MALHKAAASRLLTGLAGQGDCTWEARARIANGANYLRRASQSMLCTLRGAIQDLAQQALELRLPSAGTDTATTKALQAALQMVTQAERRRHSHLPRYEPCSKPHQLLAPAPSHSALLHTMRVCAGDVVRPRVGRPRRCLMRLADLPLAAALQLRASTLLEDVLMRCVPQRVFLIDGPALAVSSSPCCT